MSAVGLIPAAIDRRYNFVIQRLRLVTSTFTARTFHISAIATEKDADVHFVSLRFEPAKETAHSVPAIILVIVIGVFAPTFHTVNDEILIGLGQFLERTMHIDRDGANGATAFRTRAKWIVAAEKPRRRGTDVEIAMRALPAGGEGEFVTCAGGRVGRTVRNCRRHACLRRKRNDIDFALTETKRCLDGLS